MTDTDTGRNAEITITHLPDGSGGKYVAEVPGEKATGYLTWEPRGTKQGSDTKEETDTVRVATHTIVPPEIGGRGIAGLLVERLIADAKAQGFKIVPQCSYVEAKFDRNPDWADLRA